MASIFGHSQASAASGDIPMRPSTQWTQPQAALSPIATDLAKAIQSPHDLWRLTDQVMSEFKRLELHPKPWFRIQSDIRDIDGRVRWCCYIKVFGRTFGGSWLSFTNFQAKKDTVLGVIRYLEKNGSSEEFRRTFGSYSSPQEFTNHPAPERASRTYSTSADVAVGDGMEGVESGSSQGFGERSMEDSAKIRGDD